MMKFEFSGKDFGLFVFGREVFKKAPQSELVFHIEKTLSKKGLCETDFWKDGLPKIINSSKFGRIGIFYERKNINAHDFCNKTKTTTFQYTPKSKKSEKTPKISYFETQVLHEMANEGFSDSIEFRRLSRKYIRKAKHSHCDTIFFLDSILGDEKTRKILSHIAGTQIKLFFPSDFLEIKEEKNSKDKQKITIFSEETAEFTHIRAENILRTKIKK